MSLILIMHYLRRLNCISYDYYIELHLVKTNVMRINNIVEQNCFVVLLSIFLCLVFEIMFYEQSLNRNMKQNQNGLTIRNEIRN